MHFERKKTRQNPFQLTLSELLSKTLKIICEKISSWSPFPSWPFAETHLLIVSLCNRIAHGFYNTEPLFFTSMDKMRVLALQSNGKN